MSEWTAEDVLSDSRRLRGGQPIGDTTLAGLVDRVCTYCDAYAARLKADAQVVEKVVVAMAGDQDYPIESVGSVLEAASKMSKGCVKWTTINGHFITANPESHALVSMEYAARRFESAYRAACRERDEARAEVERLKKEGESHEQVR